jgi:hypothetical protein
MEVVMKNIGICLATAFISTLLSVATASARDFCGMTQAMCPAGTVQLAADSPVKPRTHFQANMCRTNRVGSEKMPV